MDALQAALPKLAAQGIKYYEVPAHTKEISAELREVLAEEWQKRRGLQIETLSFNSVTVPEDQRKKITEWEENAMTTNPLTAAARLAGSQADAMRAAASNPNGAVGGFFGMGMAQNMGGTSAEALYNTAAAMQGGAAQQPADSGWTCSCGHGGNTGKFCMECGKPKPAAGGSWTCACGSVNSGKFCGNCGKPKPVGFKCDKCGWVPDDPQNPPKFCPECGDVFDDNDRA